MSAFKPQRYKLIACEILHREACYCAALSRNIIDITFMPKGLHDMGEAAMVSALRQALDAVDTDKYDAILLGYGLCNNGVRGLSAALPLVLPRAHDCITLLMGSKERYARYFADNPGVYYKSTGWMEREIDAQAREGGVMSQLGLNGTYQQYVEQYGEDNARYIMETLGAWETHYSKMTYIDMGIGAFDGYKDAARAEAAERGWSFEVMDGDIGLLSRMMDGRWDEDAFLVTPPRAVIRPSHDEGIVAYDAPGHAG